MMKVIRQRFKAFRLAFGRDPLPNEPLFFAENSPSPQTASTDQVMKQLVQAAEAAMIAPAPLLRFLGLE
jgi:hypothetical protein